MDGFGETSVGPNPLVNPGKPTGLGPSGGAGLFPPIIPPPIAVPATTAAAELSPTGLVFSVCCCPTGVIKPGGPTTPPPKADDADEDNAPEENDPTV